MHIQRLLDRVSSTCLGLTCKRYYGIHWQLHGKVSLLEKTPDILWDLEDTWIAHELDGRALGDRLKWIAAPKLVCAPTCIIGEPARCTCTPTVASYKFVKMD